MRASDLLSGSIAASALPSDKRKRPKEHAPSKSSGSFDASSNWERALSSSPRCQYTLPKACSGAVTCTLRGELRTRTGRRLYAVTPLPGDTKLVLGTRAKFAVPKGKKGKIRFYIAVSKSQLLKVVTTPGMAWAYTQTDIFQGREAGQKASHRLWSVYVLEKRRGTWKITMLDWSIAKLKG